MFNENQHERALKKVEGSNLRNRASSFEFQLGVLGKMVEHADFYTWYVRIGEPYETLDCLHVGPRYQDSEDFSAQEFVDMYKTCNVDSLTWAGVFNGSVTGLTDEWVPTVVSFRKQAIAERGDYFDKYSWFWETGVFFDSSVDVGLAAVCETLITSRIDTIRAELYL